MGESSGVGSEFKMVEIDRLLLVQGRLEGGFPARRSAGSVGVLRVDDRAGGGGSGAGCLQGGRDGQPEGGVTRDPGDQE